jgi:hypothetical protein
MAEPFNLDTALLNLFCRYPHLAKFIHICNGGFEYLQADKWIPVLFTDMASFVVVVVYYTTEKRDEIVLIKVDGIYFAKVGDFLEIAPLFVNGATNTSKKNTFNCKIFGFNGSKNSPSSIVVKSTKHIYGISSCLPNFIEGGYDMQTSNFVVGVTPAPEPVPAPEQKFVPEADFLALQAENSALRKKLLALQKQHDEFRHSVVELFKS